ncbi:hypothetical protein M1328_00730 [Patescibacteria group bacterium]|nr:hypothetical protein [Patescibacteria group bacterium]
MEDEINKLIESIDRNKDTHPDYMSKQLEKFQALVLASHARIENAIETRIYIQVKKLIKPPNQNIWLRIRDTLRPLIKLMSYSKKVKIIESYGDKMDKLLSLLWQINDYRIEFAHPDGMNLRLKYNLAYPHGKKNVLKLLKCLDETEREMSSYFLKIDHILKMKEK